MDQYHQLSDSEKRDVNGFDWQKFLQNVRSEGRDGLSGIELELVTEGNEEARRAGVPVGGSALPLALVRRDLTATGGTSLNQGGNTIQTDKLGLLDGFHNRLVFRQGGATVLEGLQSDIDLPTLTPGTAPTHKAENANADEVSPTTAMLSLSPNRLPAFVEVSKQLVMQSSTAIETFLGRAITNQLLSIAEGAIINGSGGDAPTGILQTSGIGSVAGGTNGLAPAWSHIVELESDVALSNADIGSLRFLTNAKVRSKLKQTPRTASTDSMTILDDRAGNLLNGYTPLVTNAVPSTLVKGSSGAVCSAILFGNFADLVIGFWAGPIFEVITDQDLAIAGKEAVHVVLNYDAGLLRPQSFSAMQDALTA